MSSNTPYRIAATVIAEHPYFAKSQCGMNMQPTGETNRLLNSWGLLLKKQNNASWLLLKRAGAIQVDIDEVEELLHFNLIAQIPDFYLFTQSIKAEPLSWRLQRIEQLGVYAQLAVNLSHVLKQENEVVNVQCACKAKRWEVICMPKYNSSIHELKLTEDKNRISFEEAEQVTMPGEAAIAYRFLSTQAVALKNSYDYNIRLWEIKKTGLQQLYSSIPAPQPTSISILNPNMITSYLYF